MIVIINYKHYFFQLEMLESCHANQGAHVEAGHAGIMREEVDTFALNMNTCPDGMMSMQQTPVKGSPGEAYDHQQFKTPSANPTHLLHWQHLKTPTSSGSHQHRTPRSLPRHDGCKVCVLFHAPYFWSGLVLGTFS